MKFNMILFCFVALAPSLLSAQAGDEVVSVRFSCLAWDTTKANGLQYLNGEEVVSVRVGQSNLNGPYEYTGPNPIVFFRERPGAEPGSIFREPFARAFIKPGLTDVLILFTEVNRPVDTAAGDHAPKLETLVLNQDLGVFPMGAFRIINLSEYEVGCILGNETFVINGKQTKLITQAGEDRDDIRVHFSMKIDEHWEPKINTSWMYHADHRSLVFLTDVVNSRRPYLKLKTITDQ
ncbi:hypothetical protein SH580_03485 [Coraliomargarita algicola]|uniref:Uncharacterized protein n=1 Tax=Coraliomargarita algicola TaxID=3092156 RepID=A0ABZ0RL25_9BACT|nr:hypothetical protein [Coraliomargarita sp. J2-16]WPJ96767.1 hypothetical protein SH580_03485 [Coraliomargarita sp. J2-16]